MDNRTLTALCFEGISHAFPFTVFSWQLTRAGFWLNEVYLCSGYRCRINYCFPCTCTPFRFYSFLCTHTHITFPEYLLLSLYTSLLLFLYIYSFPCIYTYFFPRIVTPFPVHEFTPLSVHVPLSLYTFTVHKFTPFPCTQVYSFPYTLTPFPVHVLLSLSIFLSIATTYYDWHKRLGQKGQKE